LNVWSSFAVTKSPVRSQHHDHPPPFIVNLEIAADDHRIAPASNSPTPYSSTSADASVVDMAQMRMLARRAERAERTRFRVADHP